MVGNFIQYLAALVQTALLSIATASWLLLRHKLGV
jgi:hypothetical protein